MEWLRSSRAAGIAPQSGDTLWGTWRVDRLLGAANAVSYYEVTGVGGRPAVLHVLDPEASREPGRVARFVREARIARLVEHPRIVAALDEQWTDGGSACVVFERIVGVSCERIALARPAGRLEAGEVALVAEQALEALSAMHEKGMLHAGVTPRNLFWTDERGIVLAGLASARPFGIERPDLAAADAEDGASLPFLAPEQVLGDHRRLDARTDLFALGATLFFLLSGRTVRDGLAPKDRLVAALSAPAPQIGTLVPDVPPDLEALIDVALALRQADRWRSTTETLTSLRSFRSPTTRTVLFADPQAEAPSTTAASLDIGPAAAPISLPPSAIADAASPESEVARYAAWKAAAWADPAGFLSALEKDASDAVTFRLSEIRLLGELSRGSTTERVRAAEELHDAIREATRGSVR